MLLLHFQKGLYFLLLYFFSEIFRNIPYSKKINIFVVMHFFWNIPEYSIFQKITKLACDGIFLEYSWNIPYSKKTKICVVMDFFWNIPFYVFSYSILYSVEYSVIFRGIFHGIFHIPKIRCDAGA